MKVQKLTGKKLKTWTILQNLPDGERVLGKHLMIAVGEKDIRGLRRIIESIRTAGYAVGAGKIHEQRGYYELRTDEEIWEYHFRKIKALEREIDWMTENTQIHFSSKYGKSFDFYKQKNLEEMKRFEQEN